MDKTNFENLPSTNTPVSAENLNAMQSNIEKSVVAVGSSAPSTTEKFWVQKGKNLIDASKITTGYGLSDSTGETYSASNRAYFNYIEVNSNTQYTISGCTLVIVCFYGQTKNYLSYSSTTTFTTPSNCKFVRIAVNSNNTYTNAQLEQGSSVTSHEAYIPKKMYTKNSNNVFEKFCDVNDTIEVPITVLLGGATINGTYWKNELIKQGNICHLELAFAPNSTSNITIYQLPAGFFNTGNSATVALCMRNNLTAKAVITNSGAVQVQVPSASGDTWSLNATWTVY